jgi:SAM-dependent methyltransferase
MRTPPVPHQSPHALQVSVQVPISQTSDLFKTGSLRARETTDMSTQSFTPALGRFAPARFFDPVVALTRERLWRALAAMYVAPQPDAVIVDVGCGTGRWHCCSVERSRAHGSSDWTRIPKYLPSRGASPTQHRRRCNGASAWVMPWWSRWVRNSVDTVVSGLVLHQCPLPMKRAVLASINAVLRPGGKLVIADYGEVREAEVVPTVSGSISVYVARKC